FLCRCGMGMGALSLATFFGGVEAFASTELAEGGYVSPLMPKQPQFPAKAKHVIHIFANGGPSHVETFDPKPALEKYAGKQLPMENLKTERKTGAAFPSPYKFKRYGQSETPRRFSVRFSNSPSAIVCRRIFPAPVWDRRCPRAKARRWRKYESHVWFWTETAAAWA